MEGVASSTFVSSNRWPAMTKTSSIVELRTRSAEGIYAISYRDGRRLGVFRLSDGTIAETPTPDERCGAPDDPTGCLELAIGGGVATIHHVQLGLVSGFLGLEGVFLLADGNVAAVYGAEAVPIGAGRVSVG